jgi:hypothetical protein
MTAATAPSVQGSTASVLVRKVLRHCVSCGRLVLVPAHLDEAWHDTARCPGCAEHS